MRFIKDRLWSRFWTVAAPFFTSEAAGRARASLVLLVVFLLAVNGMNVVNSFVGREVMTALAEKHMGRFYRMAAALVGVFALATTGEVLTRYTEQRLGIVWREWLTWRLLDRYLAGRTYRRLAARHDIDNPDQRVTEDVKTFTTMTLSFLILLVNALLTLLAFAGILWSITPVLFVAAALYAVCGTLGTVLLGWRLVGLDNLQLRKEADFRYSLVRFREQADAVAQLGGEKEEKERLGERLGELVNNFRKIIRVNLRLGFFTTGYNYLPQIIPAALVAPLHVRGEVEFGTVTQSAMAFTQVLAAFSLIVSQFQQLSAFAAVVGRLGAMWEATEPEPSLAREYAEEGAPAPARPPAEEVPSTTLSPGNALALPGDGLGQGTGSGGRVAFDCLTLRTPQDGRLLVRDLSLEVPQGKRLLITGPSGAGKTALYLAAAGLWEGVEGRVALPEPGRVMFLSRRPYLARGRLRDVLLYALDRESVEAERPEEVLRELGADGLVRRCGGLDAERDWEKVLSEGEQQELAFARLLVANPPFAFLDDSLGALECERAEQLYSRLARTAMTYVSVGNQPFLGDSHDLRLELTGQGEWRVGAAGGEGGVTPAATPFTVASSGA
jgi:putative ATP-binding cassette transporter